MTTSSNFESIGIRLLEKIKDNTLEPSKCKSVNIGLTSSKYVGKIGDVNISMKNVAKKFATPAITRRANLGDYNRLETMIHDYILLGMFGSALVCARTQLMMTQEIKIRGKCDRFDFEIVSRSILTLARLSYALEDYNAALIYCLRPISTSETNFNSQVGFIRNFTTMIEIIVNLCMEKSDQSDPLKIVRNGNEMFCHNLDVNFVPNRKKLDDITSEKSKSVYLGCIARLKILDELFERAIIKKEFAETVKKNLQKIPAPVLSLDKDDEVQLKKVNDVKDKSLFETKEQPKAIFEEKKPEKSAPVKIMSTSQKKRKTKKTTKSSSQNTSEVSDIENSKKENIPPKPQLSRKTLIVYIRENYETQWACVECTMSFKVKDHYLTTARDHKDSGKFPRIKNNCLSEKSTFGQSEESSKTIEMVFESPRSSKITGRKL